MTCIRGTSYLVKPGDTLFLIAERQLGAGSRWIEIWKSDGTLFTEEEAKRLQPGQEVCLPGAPHEGEGLKLLLSERNYEEIFPNRNSLYSYDALVEATKKFPDFCQKGTHDQRRRELAGFLANIAHETTGGWPDAPGGTYAWGLYFVEEVNTENWPHYCDATKYKYPCVPGQTYHGRGPMQLSWNYNYGAAGEALGLDLLSNPDLVKRNGTIAFETALWFWMTPQAPKPSCHAVMSGTWSPSPEDTRKGRTPGFGMTINIINGGLECGIPNNPQTENRVGFYKVFCEMLGVSMGENFYCDRMRPYNN